MAMAFLSAKRSKDPVTQVGACIVNEKKQIVSVGYNGMPTGCSDDIFPWSKDSVDPLDRKTFYGKRKHLIHTCVHIHTLQYNVILY